MGRAAGITFWNNFSVVLSTHLSLANLSIGLVVPAMFAFVHVLVLVLLKKLIGNMVIVAPTFICVSMVLLNGDFALLPWGPLALLLSAGFLFVLLLRLGLLALFVALCCDMILNETPLLWSLTSWYSHATIIPVLVVTALVLYGFVTATAGRPFQLGEPARQA